MAIYDYTFVHSPDGTASLLFGDSEVIWSVNVVPDSPPAGYSEQDYTSLLLFLLPVGSAWPRDKDTQQSRLMAALSVELARVNDRARALLAESDPRSSSELLPDWEALTGLPAPCITAAQTVQERRDAVEAQLTNLGGQSKAFFVALAYRLGYTVTIDEFFSEAAAIAAGIPYTGTGWAYTWRVNAPAQTVRSFRVGEATVGEALRTWGNELLECVFNRLKPAHTIVLFAYA